MKLQSLVNSRAGDLRELIIFRLPVLVWRVYVLRRMRLFPFYQIEGPNAFFMNPANTSVLGTMPNTKEEAGAFESWISLVKSVVVAVGGDSMSASATLYSV